MRLKPDASPLKPDASPLIQSTGSPPDDWPAWDKFMWRKRQLLQSQKMHYRRALFAACGGDKNKVRKFLEDTEENK